MFTVFGSVYKFTVYWLIPLSSADFLYLYSVIEYKNLRAGIRNWDNQIIYLKKGGLYYFPSPYF